MAKKNSTAKPGTGKPRKTKAKPPVTETPGNANPDTTTNLPIPEGATSEDKKHIESANGGVNRNV